MHRTLEKCLQKNQQFQQELLKTKKQIELMIEDRQQQMKELLNIKDTYSPYQAPELQIQNEKCSAYLGLEIIHDSKSRRIYSQSLRYQRQFNFEDDFESNEQAQNTISHFEQLKQLKKINLQVKSPERRRFRQLKYKNKCETNSQYDADPKLSASLYSQQTLNGNQQRDYILNCIVDKLSSDGRQILWHHLPKISTQIMILNTCEQDQVGTMEVFRAWLKKKYQPTDFLPDEDKQLTRLVQYYGENQWALLSKMVGNRSSIQLRERWFKYVNPQIKKKRWSLLEDLKLMMLVDYLKPVEWYKLSPFFANRTEVQLRERWCNVLLPSLERKSWTKVEDVKLLQLKMIHGKSWSLICLQMEGRTDNECRRRWEQIERNQSKIEQEFVQDQEQGKKLNSEKQLKNQSIMDQVEDSVQKQVKFEKYQEQTIEIKEQFMQVKVKQQESE